MNPIEINNTVQNSNNRFLFDMEQGNFLNDMREILRNNQTNQGQSNENAFLREFSKGMINDFRIESQKLRFDLRQDGLTNRQVNKEVRELWKKLCSSFSQLGLSPPQEIEELYFRENYHCIEKILLCLEDISDFCSDEIRYFFQDIRCCLRWFMD